MKDEEFYSDLLFKYFSGRLAKEEEQELLAWLKESETHKNLVSEMSDWWAVAHIPLFKSDLEGDFKKHFSHIFLFANRGNTPWKYSILNRWIGIAASLLVFVVIGLSVYYTGKNHDLLTEVVDVEKETTYGEQSRIDLPDGSLVILNSGSTLRYKSDFNKTNRTVELIGEAYFEVKPDSQKPFLVNSGGLNVCVKGTSFNVKAYGDEDEIDVALVTGSVDIRFEEVAKDDVILSPRQHLSYDKNKKEVVAFEKTSLEEILWTRGIIAFSEKPFTKIAKQLERKFAVPIRIDSPVLKDEIFSGSFSPGYLLETILTEIDIDEKYRWYYDNGTLIIVDK